MADRKLQRLVDLVGEVLTPEEDVPQGQGPIEIELSGMNLLDVINPLHQVTVAMQYLDGGRWVNHLQVTFRGGAVPVVVGLFGGDATKVIASTTDVAALRGKRVRFRAVSARSLSADLVWRSRS